MDFFVEMLTLMTAGYKEGIYREPQRRCYTICRRRKRRGNANARDSYYPRPPEELPERSSPTRHEWPASCASGKSRCRLPTARSFARRSSQLRFFSCKFFFTPCLVRLLITHSSISRVVWTLQILAMAIWMCSRTSTSTPSCTKMEKVLTISTLTRPHSLMGMRLVQIDRA